MNKDDIDKAIKARIAELETETAHLRGMLDSKCAGRVNDEWYLPFITQAVGGQRAMTELYADDPTRSDLNMDAVLFDINVARSVCRTYIVASNMNEAQQDAVSGLVHYAVALMAAAFGFMRCSEARRTYTAVTSHPLYQVAEGMMQRLTHSAS